jgi:hypothetical protein
MPYSFTVDSVRKRITVRASGEFSMGDILSFRAALLAHPEVGPDMHALIDGRDVTEMPTPRELRILASNTEGFRRRFGSMRIAMLASSDYVLGMLRMYKAVLQGGPLIMEIFRDPDEARTWLAGE